MIIKNLTPEYAPQHERIAAQAFDFSCEPDKADCLPEEYMPGAFDEDGTLLADMEITDKVCFFGNGTLRCAGVGGVASKPEYRNKGAVRNIFNAVFDGSIYGDKWDVSILYPFSDTYYAKFGYASVGENNTVTFPIERLRSIERCNDVFLYEGRDKEKLLALYNKAASRYTLCFERTSAGFFPDEPYKARTFTYIHADKNGEYKSYITFSVNRAERTLNIKELLYLDREGLLAVLGFLRNYDGAMNTLVFENLPAVEPLLSYIIDKNKVTRVSKYSGSARILNLENVLKVRNYGVSQAQAVIEMQDSIEKNNGRFEITITDGEAKIERTAKEPDIILDPVSASKLILEGVSEADEIDYIPGAEIKNRKAELSRMFSKSKIIMFDGF